MQRHAESSAFSKKLTAYFRIHAHFGEEAVGIASAAVWNGDKTPNPLALIECRDDHEVQLAIRIACDYGVPLSVSAGGHDPSLRCVRDGSAVLDIRRLKASSFDRDRKIVTAGGGSLTRDVLSVLPADQVIVTGTFSTVGVAGLTMGGGYGRLNSYFGLTLDCLREATVVLADGNLVHVNEHLEPDLYWALRGGGGNFGVVTSMQFETNFVDSLLTAFILFPIAKGESNPASRSGFD